MLDFRSMQVGARGWHIRPTSQGVGCRSTFFLTKNDPAENKKILQRVGKFSIHKV